jgi:hypothetical protein
VESHVLKVLLVVALGSGCAAGGDDDIDAGQVVLIPDAAPAADAACASPSWTDLLSNGNFDEGVVGWTRAGAGILRQEGDGLPLTAHTSPWAAWFLGYANADERLSQTVEVPHDTVALRLRFQACFVTDEAGPAEDLLDIELLGLSGQLTLRTFSNQDAVPVCEWAERTFPSEKAFAGEDVTLAFHGTSNGDTNNTSFFVDTVALEAAECP